MTQLSVFLPAVAQNIPITDYTLLLQSWSIVRHAEIITQHARDNGCMHSCHASVVPQGLRTHL